VVIPASPLGKVKTIVQVGAVFVLIAVDDTGMWWVQALVYVMVLVTVVSGGDYFLNFRRKIEEAREKVVSDAAKVVARQRSEIS
jgi:CDP-diacylglycerol---glycerol-3-phosphate 3-phosphatidyltransferase